MHNEVTQVKEVCERSFLLELVLLHRHQGRHQVPQPILGFVRFAHPLGVSENVLPKIFKAPPKKAGEEEGEKEERRGGYGTVRNCIV